MIETVIWARDFGPVGFFVLAALAMTSGVIFPPMLMLAVAGGFTFGFWALPAIVIGKTIGASLAFMTARHLLRERVTRFVASRPTFQAYLCGLNAEGWKVIILLRLGSPLPGAVLSYLAGITGLRYHVFACATALGIVPPVFLCVSLGVAGWTALDGSGPGIGWGQTALLGVGVLTTSTAALVVSRAAKARLASYEGGLVT